MRGPLTATAAAAAAAMVGVDDSVAFIGEGMAAAAGGLPSYQAVVEAGARLLPVLLPLAPDNAMDVVSVRLVDMQLLKESARFVRKGWEGTGERQKEWHEWGRGGRGSGRVGGDGEWLWQGQWLWLACGWWTCSC